MEKERKTEKGAAEASARGHAPAAATAPIEEKAPTRATSSAAVEKSPVGIQKSTPKKKEESPPARGTGDGPLARIWSRRMALIGLKRIFETALAGARTEIRDEDGALIEVKFNPSAANAATKAIEVANRMMGYAAPEEERTPEPLSLSVEFGEWEEFAE